MNDNTIKLMLMRCAQLWPGIHEPFEAVATTLTPRERGIIQGLFGIGYPSHSLRELARHYRIRLERVEQIRDKAFRKIGHPLRAEIVSHLMSACDLPGDVEEEKKGE